MFQGGFHWVSARMSAGNGKHDTHETEPVEIESVAAKVAKAAERFQTARANAGHEGADDVDDVGDDLFPASEKRSEPVAEAPDLAQEASDNEPESRLEGDAGETNEERAWIFDDMDTIPGIASLNEASPLAEPSPTAPEPLLAPPDLLRALEAARDPAALPPQEDVLQKSLLPDVDERELELSEREQQEIQQPEIPQPELPHTEFEYPEIHLQESEQTKQQQESEPEETDEPDIFDAAGDAEGALPKFLEEPTKERAPPRNAAWIVLTSAAVLAVFMVGALRIGLPDASNRVATSETHADEQPSPMRFAVKEPNRAQAFVPAVERNASERKQQLASESEPATHSATRPPAAEQPPTASAPVAVPPLLAAQRPTVSPLRFEDAVVCSDAASCGVPEWAVAHDEPEPPTPIDPNLGAAVDILNRVRPSKPEPGSAIASSLLKDLSASDDDGTSEAGPETHTDVRPPVVLPIAFSDIGDIEIVLAPAEEPGAEAGDTERRRAQIALRKRDGRELARFNVVVTQPAETPEAAEVREQSEPEETAPAQSPEDTAADTADVSRNEATPEVDSEVKDSTTLSSAKREPPAASSPEAKNETAPVAAADPDPATVDSATPSRPKASNADDGTARVRRARNKVQPKSTTPSGTATSASVQQGAPSDQGPAPPPQRPSTMAKPRGLLTLQAPPEATQPFWLPLDPAPPPSSAQPPAARQSAAPERSPNDFASQPTPKTVDQAPGIETLMGLGGTISEVQP